MHSCQVIVTTKKRDFSQEKQQLLTLQVMVKETPDNGIIPHCELRR